MNRQSAPTPTQPRIPFAFPNPEALALTLFQMLFVAEMVLSVGGGRGRPRSDRRAFVC